MIQIHKDSTGQYRWRAVAKNGQIVATSHRGYKTRAGALKGIRATREIYTHWRLQIRDNTTGKIIEE